MGSDERGLGRLFRQFSFPGGIPSHVAPEVPGSIHEGGELGYALVHAFGAAFDNPDLLVACVVGDGEAETGPLAASWHSNKFLNPRTDGAVLPVLHLNGFKIANPTVLARIPERELVSLLEGYGWRPILVTGGFDGEDPALVHQRLAAALDEALDGIDELQRRAREDGVVTGCRWPMLVLRTPKGWTGPKEVDGKQTENSWRSHQVPMAAVRDSVSHVRQLEAWLRGYRPEELFDQDGRLVPTLRALPPEGERRMSANPHANGGALLRDLVLPDFRDYAVEVDLSGNVDERGDAGARRPSCATSIARNPDNFRLFGPDETASNRLGDVFSVTDRTWLARTEPDDEGLSSDGRVMEILSEHLCQGWLEGYLLTGRHGLFNCYEAFIHIVDSMFNQHAKWLKTTREIPWRRPIASLNYLLSSHVWRQDHNGFSHQDPGFIDHVVNKKAELIRVYLPPDANTLLSVADHCLRSRNYVNVIVAGKQPALNYLSMDDAISPLHAAASGSGTGRSTDEAGEPDVVLGCAGEIPTLETLAAAALLREHLPGAEGPRRQRGRPDAPAVGVRASARALGRRVRCALHDHAADRLCLPRLPVADPPPHLQAPQPRESPRTRLQGGRDDDDAVRHGDAQRPRSLPSRDRRDRPRSRARRACRAPASGDGGASSPCPCLHPRARRGRPRDQRLDVAGVNILVVNAGSTSLKLALVDEEQATPVDGFVAADAVGHRIVHLGGLAIEAEVVDDWLLRRIEEGAQVAPLHNRPALEALERAREALPDVPHVAVSDSHFHGRWRRRRAGYALPRWRDWSSIVRLGFHGFAVAVRGRAGRCRADRRLSPRRRLFGHGRADGRSVDTTMGYTPLEGPPMGTRSGSVDPGALLHLVAERPYGRRVDHVSTRSQASKALGGLDESFAFSHFTYHLAKAVAGMAAVFGGIDVLAFSGGIGENRADVREAVARRLRHLGSFG